MIRYAMALLMIAGTAEAKQISSSDLDAVDARIEIIELLRDDTPRFRCFIGEPKKEFRGVSVTSNLLPKLRYAERKGLARVLHTEVLSLARVLDLSTMVHRTGVDAMASKRMKETKVYFTPNGSGGARYAIDSTDALLSKAKAVFSNSGQSLTIELSKEGRRTLVLYITPLKINIKSHRRFAFAN